MVKSLALGFLTGMRSMTPLATWTRAVQANNNFSDGSLVDVFQLPSVKALTTLAAAGELVADKTPWIPDRRDLMPLLGRIGFGSLIGASASQAQNASAGLGAVVGGGAAFVGTHAGAALRRWIAKYVPQPFDGIIEDVLVIAGSFAATKK